jgi:hypothetical protein
MAWYGSQRLIWMAHYDSHNKTSVCLYCGGNKRWALSGCVLQTLCSSAHDHTEFLLFCLCWELVANMGRKMAQLARGWSVTADTAVDMKRRGSEMCTGPLHSVLSHFQLTLSECSSHQRLCSTCSPCFVSVPDTWPLTAPVICLLSAAQTFCSFYRDWKVVMEINWYAMLPPHLSTELPAVSTCLLVRAVDPGFASSL